MARGEVEQPQRVIEASVPGRGTGEPGTPEERWRFLEELTLDAWVMLGVDARKPMRRDVVRVARRRAQR